MVLVSGGREVLGRGGREEAEVEEVEVEEVARAMEGSTILVAHHRLEST